MTTATLTRSATRAEAGGYSFRSAARMEWLKLRSVRSTAWILLVFAAGMIGLSVLVLSHEHWATMSAARPRRPSTRSTRASPGWRSASSPSASSACSRSPPSSPRA